MYEVPKNKTAQKTSLFEAI